MRFGGLIDWFGILIGWLVWVWLNLWVLVMNNLG
jgi:hypothetical protein